MTIPENDPITLSNNLLHSLLDQQIPLIQSFKGKWSLIKSKLADLQAQLTDFSEFQTSITNPLALDLLHSVSQTLNDALLLAEKCLDTNLTEGKLKTQSDIDSILAKLNQNVRDWSTESKNAAMDTVLSLIEEDDKNVLIAVAQGIVPVLARLLDCNSCFDIKEKSVAAISRISMVDSSKHVLIAEGLLLLNQLIRILESGSWFAKEKACVALQALSFSRENARAIGSRGGICSLLEICQAGTPSSQGLASGVLRNLAVFEEIRENFIEENAVFVLIGLAASGTALAQENAIGCLCNLVKEDENLKLLIVKEGVVECLRNFWDSCPPARSLEVAVELLRELASNQAIAEGLVSDGFVVRLVAVLSCGVLVAVEEKEAAAKSIVIACVACCGHLKKLMEMDVEGSKKLLDGLGRGKIWVFCQAVAWT
ncbi:hypothetical protein NC653_034050 [Populus alba x Populus x berolinensis]|uniref:DUF7032 domain-containing protein n=1 Tax=Populus alba x Populus x berolinensis TaxID=444605 RepID=A0AAD6LLU8_9ROSI|nr:hypothetical protein NC653_034050 [Populus alba x Populus x berolinensis]